MSGKRKQNTGKSTVISDGEGRLLGQGAFRPGRMHDVTASARASQERDQSQKVTLG